MRILGQFSLVAALLFAPVFPARSQVCSVRVVGTIWELPPEESARFISDHSFSIADYNVSHTKALGWTLSGPGVFRQLWPGEDKVLWCDMSASKSGFQIWPLAMFATVVLAVLAVPLRRRLRDVENDAA